MSGLDKLGGPVENPELDQTKKALEGLKGQIESKNITEVFDPKGPLAVGFMKDMEEAGITDTNEKNKYWGQIQTEVQQHLIDKTSESKNIDEFIGHVEGLEEFQKIIAKTETEGNFDFILNPIKKFAGKYGVKAATLAGVFSWLAKNEVKKSKPAEEDEPGWLYSAYLYIAEQFGFKPSKKDGETNKPAEVLTDALKKKIGEIAANEKFKDLHLNTDPKALKEDLKWLAQGDVGIKVDESNVEKIIEDTFVKKEKIKELLKKADDGVSGSNFDVRLSYLKLGKFDDTQITKLTTIIDGKDGDYNLPRLNKDNLHTLLTTMVKAKTFENGLRDLPAEFRVVKPAPTTVAAVTPQEKR